MRAPALAVFLGLFLAGCLQQAETVPSSAPTTDAPPLGPACDAPGFQIAELNATIETSKGDIGVVLYAGRSPATVCNFLHYVAADFYDATVFHRICAHVIQAGGLEPVTGMQKPAREPIRNEANESRLRNYQGTLGMARSDDPDSATSHFYVNNRDNLYLDYDGEYAPGYAVFGNVTRGWDVVVEIASTQTLPENPAQTSCTGRPVPTMETTIRDVRLDP